MPHPRDDLAAQLPHLRAFARSLTGGNWQLADDLVQDTAVLALRKWHQFTPGTNLTAWLLKILHNRFRSLIGRKHVTSEISDDGLLDRRSVPAPQEGRLEVAAFKQAFAKLKPAHRAVLVLSVVHGLPYEEVAAICGCEAGTVKSRVNRARTQLKKMLLGEEDGDGPPARREASAIMPAPVLPGQ